MLRCVTASVVILPAIFLVTGCNREKALPLADLAASTVQAIPYKDGETVKFRDSGNNIIHCIVKRTEFERPNGGYRAKFIEWTLNIDGDAQREMIHIVLGGGPPDLVFLEVHLRFNPDAKIAFQNLRIAEDGNYKCSAEAICHDTMLIAGITEHHVVELPGNIDPFGLTITRVIYSKQKGVLHCEYNNGQSYTRAD